MDSLFHFLFPMIALLAARIRIKHSIPTIIGLSFLAVILDIDHFFGMASRGTFHNVFVTLVLPIIIIILAFKYGKETHRQIAIALLLVLFSHVILDFFSEGTVMLFYPLTTARFDIDFTIMFMGYGIVSSASIGLLIYFVILLMVLFLEEIDRFMIRKHESFKKAFFDAVRKEERKL